MMISLESPYFSNTGLYRADMLKELDDLADEHVTDDVPKSLPRVSPGILSKGFSDGDIWEGETSSMETYLVEGNRTLVMKLRRPLRGMESCA